jgi:hypothetical protein
MKMLIDDVRGQSLSLDDLTSDFYKRIDELRKQGEFQGRDKFLALHDKCDMKKTHDYFPKIKGAEFPMLLHYPPRSSKAFGNRTGDELKLNGIDIKSACVGEAYPFSSNSSRNGNIDALLTAAYISCPHLANIVRKWEL